MLFSVDRTALVKTAHMLTDFQSSVMTLAQAASLNFLTSNPPASLTWPG